MLRLSLLSLIYASSLAFAADDPLTAARLASFTKDIKPILDKTCIGCHGKDGKKPKGGFNAITLDGIVKGGKEEGKGITWGDAEKSSLYHLAFLGATAREDEKAMPPYKKDKKHEPLTTAQLATIKAWIEAK
jgi:mono/diheme cytochrome c family protein